jgi:T5SS/PEP-CTERM-associated repeat protein
MLPNGAGTVIVTGADSSLQIGGEDTLFVGFSGTGVLDVNMGGSVTTESAVVGGTPNGTGTLVVSDAGSTFAASNDMEVGAWGTGTVIVANGGAVTTGNLNIGGFDESEVNDLPAQMLADFGNATGTGTVTVTGTGSSLSASGITYIGYSGNGTLDVNDGGTVTSVQAGVGVEPGSQGTVTINGEGSKWTVNRDDGFETETGSMSGVLFVGGYGRGSLTVSNGGKCRREQHCLHRGVRYRQFRLRYIRIRS